jgi:hypothetical protein
MAVDLLRLRYPTSCATCGRELPKGTEASWNREQKRATCTECLTGDPSEPLVEPEIDRGEAGGSAAREWKRRHEKRESQIRSRYGKLGGLVLAFSEDPHSTNAWAYGANGERALGRVLDPLREEGMGVLHDRRIPGSRANIDHIVVAPYGVFVIDAKNYKGKVERRDRGGFFSTDYRLYVGNRDKSALIAGMRKQAEAVRKALNAPPEEIPIIQTICFVAADWSLFARPIQFDAVQVLWPSALAKQLHLEGPLSSERITTVEQQLALALPAA